MTPNKQLERTVIRQRVRAACASFHYARAARWTRGHAAAELRRRRLIMRIALLAALVLGSSACTSGEPPRARELVSEGYSFSDPDRMERLKTGLTSAGIPFTTEVRDGNEYVDWEGRYADKANAVRIELFGPDLPSNRNIAMGGELQVRFKAWLAERSIPYQTVEKEGVEYIIWEESIDEAVRQWPYLPPIPD